MKLSPSSLSIFFMFVTSCFARAQTAFIDATTQAGINHVYSGHNYGGGVVCADFNNDGYLDLFALAGRNKPNLFCLNKKDGTFEEAAAAAGLTDGLFGLGAVAGDVDNDGDLDLYVVNFLAANKLYLNNGNAQFTDATIVAGVGDTGPGIGAAMADYNNDGYLDIYVINYSTSSSPSRFYRNNGNGTFTDVTAATKTGVLGRSLGVGFFDYDLDGDQDLYVVDEYNLDHLFRNDGNGVFTDVTKPSQITETDGMGIDFADYDNDGDFDFYIGDFNADPLFRNNGDGTFTNVAAQAGIDNTGVGWGVNFMDYDNDGDKEVYVINGPLMLKPEQPNVFFDNTGNGVFTRMGPGFGASFQGEGRGSVGADFNRDGYVDIFFVSTMKGQSKLLMNRGGSNNWIVLNLAGTKSNRSAVGARVEVVAGNLKQVDEVRAGSSYASMHPLELEFGLGQKTQIDRINVYWPSGERQTLANVAVNQVLKIAEPSAPTAVSHSSDRLPEKFALQQNFPNPMRTSAVNAATEIHYQLAEAGEVNFKIINISGQTLRSFDLGWKNAGEYKLKWDGKTQNGAPAPAGVYFYQLTAKSGAGARRFDIKKMVLLE
jgi:hypothetical protein